MDFKNQMKIKESVLQVVILLILMTTSGCATYKTLESPDDNSQMVFSGTRLDLNTINKNEVALKKIKVVPPRYPLLDLPASLMLDIIVLPATAIIDLFKVITE